MRAKKGPPTIPSLPYGPAVLNFSPVAENNQTLDHAAGESKPVEGRKIPQPDYREAIVASF
jgi:hypothetical protein